MKNVRFSLIVLGASLVLALLLGALAAPTDAAPPRGKHYAVVLILVEPETGEIDAAPACLSFTRGEMCTEANDCGPWEFVTKRGHQNEWRGLLEFQENGETVRAEIRGITERFGTGNSIGGTVIATLEGAVVNAGFAGTRVPRAACLEFGLSDD